MVQFAQKSVEDYSLVRMREGKKPFEKSWEKYCREHRDFDEALQNHKGNYGITTGPANGFLVLDIDDEDRFEEVRKQNGWDTPETLTVRTGGGGRHLYYKYPTKGNEVYGNKSSKDDGFDIRGDGGCVVAPGSRHPVTGRRYEVELDVPVAEAPEWMLELAEKDDSQKAHSQKASGGGDPSIQIEEIVDIASLDLSPNIRELITNGAEEGKRSEAIWCVLNSLLELELTDGQILGIFESQMIGEKYLEKGNSRQKWLLDQIHKIRKEVGSSGKPKSKDILEALGNSEVGDAILYCKLFRGQFCYDHQEGAWYHWNQSHWKKDITREALAGVNRVVELYREEINRQKEIAFKAFQSGNQPKVIEANGLVEKLTKRKQKLQKLQRQKNVVDLAASGEECLGIPGDEWDRNQWVLGCQNGVVDLRNGEFRESTPEDYIKTISPIEWPGLDAPEPVTWINFLSVVFQDDDEMIGFMQRLLGYSITGLSTEHILPILIGQGRNGKGTMLETLNYILGSLAQTIPSETLLSQRNSSSGASHNADLMLLRGRRIVWTSETNDGRSFDSATVKRLVGGDTITARAPHAKHHVTFAPTHTAYLLTNSKPHANADDYALWKRILMIEFKLSFVPDPKEPHERKADPDLLVKLKAEASGILAWIVRGCLEWQKQGLNPPSSIREATEEYRKGEDVIGRFIDESCEVSQGLEVKSNDLYQAYDKWCKSNGHHPLSNTKFGKKIGSMFEKKKSGVYCYLGIGLSDGSKDEF